MILFETSGRRPAAALNANRRGWALIAGAVVIVALRSTGAAAAAYVLLALYGIFGPSQAIRALTMSWLITLLNVALVGESSAASLGRYAVIASTFVSTFVRLCVTRRVRLSVRLLIPSVLIGIFLVAHSIFVSPLLGVSLLKAISWTTATVTLFVTWSALSETEHRILEKQLFWGLGSVLVVSLPLLASSKGYFKQEFGVLFQGILNQPQAFGVAMALFGAWLAGSIFASRRPLLVHIAFLSCVVAIIFFSQSRTSGLALLLGTFGGLGLTVTNRRHLRLALPSLFNARVYLLIIACGVAALATGPSLADSFWHFVMKGTDSRSAVEAYDTSRGRMARSMWANIESHWLAGIGFGVPSDSASLEVETDPLLGIPISAPVEKGVLPLAVLEELGFIGATIVLWWMMLLLRQSAQGGIVSATVFCVLLATNFGESVLFSPGGMGLLLLIVCAWAATKQSAPRASMAPHA